MRKNKCQKILRNLKYVPKMVGKFTKQISVLTIWVKNQKNQQKDNHQNIHLSPHFYAQ